MLRILVRRVVKASGPSLLNINGTGGAKEANLLFADRWALGERALADEASFLISGDDLLPSWAVEKHSERKARKSVGLAQSGGSSSNPASESFAYGFSNLIK